MNEAELKSWKLAKKEIKKSLRLHGQMRMFELCEDIRSRREIFESLLRRAVWSLIDEGG